MNTLLTYWHLLGWTMLYFLATGTLVLLIGAALRISLTRANPRIRYTTSLAVFAILALLPVLIAGYLTASLPRERGEFITPEFTTNLTNNTNQDLTAKIAKNAKKNLITTENKEITEGKNNTVLPPEETAPISFASVLNATINYLPWLWLVGTPLTFLLLATGLVGAERLRRSCKFLTNGPIHESSEKLRIALGISRQVGIAICERIATPILVGVVKPLILLPPAALNGWTTAELEMVLLHELAHVRRWDNAVNLVQRIVESLLFFHPAVWIMSTWVRRDREDCCDAVVIGHTAKPQAYAELLLALASHQPLVGLASSAMAQHPVAARIHRILKLEDEPMLVSRKGLMLSVSAGMAVVLCVVFLAPSEAEESVSRESQRVGDERSGEEVTTNPTNRTNKKFTTESTEKKSPLFPSLEEQKAADFAYKVLGVELEKLSAEELKRVQALRYQGGLRAFSVGDIRESSGVYGGGGGGGGGGVDPSPFLKPGDLLVGLHVWPTESLAQVNEILARDDLDQLSPLKFYVIRQVQVGGGGAADDQVVTGRVQVDLDAWREMKEQRRADSGLPYLLKAGDVLLIVAYDDSQPDRNKIVDDAYSIDQDGSVNFGPLYGKVFIAGNSLEDARYLIEIELRTKVPKCVVKVTLIDGERPTNSTRSDTAAATPLYDGKTFEEWRDLWKTELKTEKRTECIHALAAFGNAGKSKEAAATILDVAGEYDFYVIDGSAEGKLKESVLEMLTSFEHSHLAEREWLPLLKERLDKEPAKYKWLGWNLLARLGTNDANVKQVLLDLQKNSEQTIRQAVLLAILNSRDIFADDEKKNLVQATLSKDAITALNVVGGNRLNLIKEDQLLSFLMSNQHELQVAARKPIRWIRDKEKGVRLTNALLAILKDQEREHDHLATVRALAALRYYAVGAEPHLNSIIEATTDEDMLIAAVYARESVRLEERQLQISFSDDTRKAIEKTGRWQKLIDDNDIMLEKLAVEHTKVTGEERSNLGSGGMGGGIGGGGGGGAF